MVDKKAEDLRNAKKEYDRKKIINFNYKRSYYENALGFFVNNGIVLNESQLEALKESKAQRKYLKILGAQIDKENEPLKKSVEEFNKKYPSGFSIMDDLFKDPEASKEFFSIQNKTAALNNKKKRYSRLASGDRLGTEMFPVQNYNDYTVGKNWKNAYERDLKNDRKNKFDRKWNMDDRKAGNEEFSKFANQKSRGTYNDLKKSGGLYSNLNNLGNKYEGE